MVIEDLEFQVLVERIDEDVICFREPIRRISKSNQYYFDKDKPRRRKRLTFLFQVPSYEFHRGLERRIERKAGVSATSIAYLRLALRHERRQWLYGVWSRLMQGMHVRR